MNEAVRALYFACGARADRPERGAARAAARHPHGRRSHRLARGRRDEGYAAAFAEPRTIRVAIDKRHARHEEAIAGAREIAFFPPMTGG